MLMLQAVIWDVFALCLSSKRFHQGQAKVDQFFIQCGMDKMGVEGYRRQRTIAQLLFESLPQVVVQACALFKLLKVERVMESAYSAVVLSLCLSAINVVSQFGKVHRYLYGFKKYFY
jgi:hypothetical protein